MPTGGSVLLIRKRPLGSTEPDNGICIVKKISQWHYARHLISGQFLFSFCVFWGEAYEDGALCTKGGGVDLSIQAGANGCLMPRAPSNNLDPTPGRPWSLTTVHAFLRMRISHMAEMSSPTNTYRGFQKRA